MTWVMTSVPTFAKSLAGSSSPSTYTCTRRVTPFFIPRLLWGHLMVDAHPAAVLIDLDMYDRMDLPQRVPRLIDLLRVLLVEQSPATDANVLADQPRQRRIGPAGPHIADARRHLNHH